MKNSNTNNLQLISWILRFAMASLFLATAMIKVPNGIGGTVEYYESIFEGSMFPPILVSAHASIIIFLEFALAIWLIVGFRLRWAWVASGLTLISLAFGMIFVYKFDVASDNYVYVLIAVVGLYFSSYDKLQWGQKKEDDMGVVVRRD